MSNERPIPAVGVVCIRDDQVLLIRRGQPPRMGEWSLPGGRIEFGERVEAAALRELREETGVEAELCGLIEVVDGFFEETDGTRRHYVLIDYVARWISGEPLAGDDAAEACFRSVDDIGLVAWPETRRIICKAAVMIGRAVPDGVDPRG